MTIEEINARYGQSESAGESREDRHSKELLERILCDRYAQITIYRMAFIVGQVSYIVYCHEYTDRIIKDPIYVDIPSVFAPEWYNEEEIYNHCMIMVKDFDLLCNPVIKIFND